MTVWVIVAGGALVLLLLAALIWSAPARANIVVETAGSTARADMRTLWGLGPSFSVRALPRSGAGNPLAVFNDPVRIGHALMTPGLMDAAYDAVRELFQLRPRAARVELRINLADAAQARVVLTAAQAALAAAPAALRDSVVLGGCEAPGAELAVRFELSTSPARLSAIYARLKQARPVREFRRRLKRKIKPAKKAPKEIQAS